VLKFPAEPTGRGEELANLSSVFLAGMPDPVKESTDEKENQEADDQQGDSEKS
jgi:hypothetical protein